MNNPEELFSSEEMMRFEAVLKRHIEAAAKAPLLILMTLLAGLALAVVGYSEFEIVYRVFDYLAGENNE